MSEPRIDVRKGIAREVLDIAVQYFDEAGPCDHSVNICRCDLVQPIYEFASDLGIMDVYERFAPPTLPPDDDGPEDVSKPGERPDDRLGAILGDPGRYEGSVRGERASEDAPCDKDGHVCGRDCC